MRMALPRTAAVKRGAGPNSPRLTAEVSSVSTQPAPISMSACKVEVGSATRCSRFTPRRISARVASIGTPEDSRGTTTIAPSGMAATASPTEEAMTGTSHLSLDVVLLHHRSPELSLRGGKLAEFLRPRHHQRNLLALGQRLRYALLANARRELLVEALDDRLWRARRREHAPPRIGGEIRHATFDHGRALR